ncbi:MAG TPA: hypothetical protein VIH87_06020 [Methylocella sp.]
MDSGWRAFWSGAAAKVAGFAAFRDRASMTSTLGESDTFDDFRQLLFAVQVTISLNTISWVAAGESDPFVRTIELTATVTASERSLLRGQWHLRRAQWFIVRLFTKRAIPKLVNQLTSAGDALAPVIAHRQILPREVDNMRSIAAGATATIAAQKPAELSNKGASSRLLTSAA